MALVHDTVGHQEDVASSSSILVIFIAHYTFMIHLF